MKLKIKKRWRFIAYILETWKYIKKDYFLFFLMLLFDFLFLFLVYVIGVSIRKLINPLIVISILVVYYLLIIFIYSFFKLIILGLIKKMITKVEFSLKRIVGFFGLNLIVFNVFFVVFLVLSALVYYTITEDYQTSVIRTLFVVFLMLCYPLVNLVHSFFIQNLPIKDSIVKGLVGFRKVRKYAGVYIFSILFLGVYFLVYALIALLLKYLFLGDLISRHNNVYVLIFLVISLLVFYCILAFNRIHFYLVVDKGVLS